MSLSPSTMTRHPRSSFGPIQSETTPPWPTPMNDSSQEPHTPQASQPIKPATPRKPRGKLDRFKCEPCRRDKQKCEPQSREWPDRCHRCKAKGFACSENTRKRKQITESDGMLVQEPSSDPSTPSTSFRNTPTKRSRSRPQLKATETRPAVWWNPTDFSNAISFLRTLRKAAARAQQWNSDLEDMFPGICGPYDQPNEGMSPLIQRMHDKIFKSLCQRIQTVDRLNDRPSRLEATALRSLLLTLVGQLTGKSPHELEPFDESLASMVLRDTSFETDLGLALTLRSRMIAGSTRFNSRLMTEYTTLLMNFQHVLQPLVTNIDCRDLIPPDPYHCALFDEWARGVPATADAFWNIQDYLGSTVAQVYLQDFHSMCGEGEDSVANPARDVVHVLRFSPASYKDVADRHGRTLLHIAAQYNFSDVIKVMLGLSLDVDVRTKRNSTALHYAASLGHLEVCNVLLQESANANARDCMGRTPLHYAAVADRHNVVARFLGLPEINCSVQDGHGRTPFMWAITGKGRTSENCCQLFSTRLQNADLQIADNEGQTVLHFAANMRPGSQKQLEMLETVASKCPGLINRQSHSGDTVLTVVSARPEPENLRTVQCLLSIEGIDAGLRNKEGMTALHCAAKNGHLEVCRLLGLRVDGGLLAKCNAGFTPCKYAESNNHASVALLLQRFEDRALAYASDQHLRG